MRRTFHGSISACILCALFATPNHASAGDKKEGSQLLVAFGASVGALLFETHDKLSICELAAGRDGVNAKEIETKLAITSNVLKVLIDNLAKAHEDKLLSDADRTFVVKATDAAKLVQAEANALKVYITTKDAKDRARYQDCRKRADQEIRLILGIKN